MNRGRFAKGTSGNPSGRPPGSRNRASLAVETLMEGEAERLSRKAVELALNGNVVALRLCLERVAPARRGHLINLKIGGTRTLAELAEAQSQVLEGMANGDLTVEEAADAARAIEAVGSAYERRELETRLAALEEKMR
jgi:hypothetical protein